MLTLPPSDLSRLRTPSASPRGHAQRSEATALGAAARLETLRIAATLGAPPQDPATGAAPDPSAPDQARPLAELLRVLTRIVSAVLQRAAEPSPAAAADHREDASAAPADRPVPAGPRLGPEITASAAVPLAPVPPPAGGAVQTTAMLQGVERAEQPAPRAELVPPPGRSGSRDEARAAVPAALVAGCLLALAALLLAAA